MPGTTGVQSTQLPERSIPIGMPDGREFVGRIEPVSAASSCRFRYFQSGAFGGIGSDDVRPMGGGAFAIRTGVGDKPARSLKVSVSCPGAGMALLNVPALESSGYERTLSLVPLKPVPLAGRVLPTTDGVSLAGAEVRVDYVAYWLCGFFDLPDCGVPQWQVATGRISADGTFRVMVPDFAADPAIKPWAFASNHVFKLRADRSTAPYNYWLDLDGGKAGEVAIASTYPALRFQPRRQ